MKPKIIWLANISCNGNAHSFLNYPHIETLLESFEFLYHPIIDTDYTLQEVVNGDLPCDILMLEGAISPTYKKADELVANIINKYAKKAKKIVTIGTCATYGGIFGEYAEDITGLHFNKEQALSDFAVFKKKTISVSGCPIHPNTLAGTLYNIKKSLSLPLDEYLRPKEYFTTMIHNGCTRNEYFEYKIDNYEFGSKQGCLFYDHGCQAPYTHGSCNKVLWNEVNSKTRSGAPCMGCTEPTFPKRNLFATKKNMGIPETLPLDVSKRAYLTLAGVAKAFKVPRLERTLDDD